MKLKALFLVHCAVLLFSACSSPQVFSSEPLTESKIYKAEGVENEKIQFIWMEIPVYIEPGEEYVRLFLAKMDPPEPAIPNPNDLRCILSENEIANLGPERVLFEFRDNGEFTGSYTYKACPPCIECYMNWDYTLEMTGRVTKEMVLLDIAIKHFGHNVQGFYVSAELKLLPNANKEPRIICDRSVACKDIKFVKME